MSTECCLINVFVLGDLKLNKKGSVASREAFSLVYFYLFSFCFLYPSFLPNVFSDISAENFRYAQPTADENLQWVEAVHVCLCWVFLLEFIAPMSF